MSNESNEISRRTVLGSMAAAGAGAMLAQSTPADAAERAVTNGRLKQSVCKWCYRSLSLEELAKASKTIGLQSVELLDEDDWAVVKEHGLTCAMANGPSGIVNGWNRPADHKKLVAESERLLPLVKDAGLPNMIVFSGNRRGLDDKTGLKNCAKGLKEITPLAEKLGVTVCMELLNSKRDHKDYQCDYTEWGVNLVKEVGSPRFKLLYDIYHMQIMEGNIIDTIQKNIDHIAHFHTGGVPGRNEIDDTQELNYATICKAIVDTGFDGYLAQEFIPKRDPLTSLAEAAVICDV